MASFATSMWKDEKFPWDYIWASLLLFNNAKAVLSKAFLNHREAAEYIISVIIERNH